MKKFVFSLAFLISGISFSGTCHWIKNPNFYVKKEIELINTNKMNLKGNIYCDVDRDYLTYYIGTGNLEVGLVYNEKEKKELTYENIMNILLDFENDIAKLVPDNIPAKNLKEKPQFYTYRLYIYDAKQNDTYMFFKYIFDTTKPDGDWKMYYNSEIFSKMNNNVVDIFQKNGYGPTEDIVY
ncbi:hypothetical protein J5A73_02070 [Leptotrichia sp. oral taxon 218]|jgi:hypothetical protein|uniref:hypothetical protein n=1 Tax=Leptotrichia sp. oral taxon 218 TaxID=712361 RepID=UPI001B8B4BE9|nr:hypothetical protein [Leptotrichia sp. oral taxon 218]QUB95684.1 hypothetical protein J5A73_02070 [Leptotrichia sp. oral taxon 218]